MLYLIAIHLGFPLQKKYTVRTSYLEGQEITGKMRAILIDWLCQVHHRFHLLQETLYLTVAIIDRFLQVNAGIILAHFSAKNLIEIGLMEENSHSKMRVSRFCSNFSQKILNLSSVLAELDIFFHDILGQNYPCKYCVLNFS